MLKTIVPLCAVGLLLCAAGCGGDSTDSPASVAPAGAPYSYDVPDGFEEIDSTFPGEGAKFLTTVVPSGTSHEGFLSAFQMHLDPTQRAYATPRMLAWLDEVTHSFYEGVGATVGAGTDATVAGHPAICWKIHHFRNESDGLVEVDSCAIVSGHDVIQQACTWKPATQGAVQRGCEALRKSLEIS